MSEVDFPLFRVRLADDSGREYFVTKAVGVGFGVWFAFNFDFAVRCTVVGGIVLGEGVSGC